MEHKDDLFNIDLPHENESSFQGADQADQEFLDSFLQGQVKFIIRIIHKLKDYCKVRIVCKAFAGSSYKESVVRSQKSEDYFSNVILPLTLTPDY